MVSEVNMDRVIIEGKGEPVVLVHGMGGPRIWESIRNKIKEYYTIITPTFPGFIENDGIIGYSDELYTDFLEELRFSLAYDKWSIVGISMGGRTVINYALKYPDRVKKVIVIDSAGLNDFSPLFTLPIVRSIAPQIISWMLSNPKNALNLAAEDFVNREGPAAKLVGLWFLEMMKNPFIRKNFSNILTKIGVKKQEWYSELVNIKAQTLILWSSDDKTCPIECAYQLNRLIIGSQLSVLQGYKHMGLMEHPEFFIEHINGFLKSD